MICSITLIFINTETYEDVLLWRRFVTETLCYGDVCIETFSRGDVLWGDVLYVYFFLSFVLCTNISPLLRYVQCLRFHLYSGQGATLLPGHRIGFPVVLHIARMHSSFIHFCNFFVTYVL
jgi:hypothetical protein